MDIFDCDMDCCNCICDLWFDIRPQAMCACHCCHFHVDTRTHGCEPGDTVHLRAVCTPHDGRRQMGYVGCQGRWSVQYFLVSVYVAFLSIWFILGPWMILWSSIMLCVVVPEKEEGLELESQSGFHLTQPHDAPAFNANVYGAKTW